MPIVVRGLDDLEHDLEQVRDDAADQLDGVVSDLVQAGAEAARRRAPRRTNALAGSVHAEPAAVVAGSPRVTYAAAVNYGSPRRHIAAVPFMDAAAEVIEAQAPAAIDTRLDNLLDQNGFTR